MKKVFLILLLILIIPISHYGQSNKMPEVLKNHAVLFKDELDSYFYRASVYFINFNDKLAVNEIKKAIDFVNIEISQTDENGRKSLDPIIADLNLLMTNLGLSNLENIQPLKLTFARSHHKLARFYCNKAKSLYNNNSYYGSIVTLNAASSYLVYGVKWIGYEPSKGTRSTRIAINNATTSIMNREEVKMKDYQKLLNYIDSEIRAFGNIIPQ